MPKLGERDEAKEIFWRGKLVEQVGSGLTVKGFCRSEGIRVASFYYWRKEIARRDLEQNRKAGRCDRPVEGAAVDLFAPVSIVDEGSGPGRSRFDVSGGSFIEVGLASGHFLRVRPGFDSETFVRLVRLLEDFVSYNGQGSESGC